MKQIKIQNIELHNFKGIKDLKINFNDETNIFGANASGKTTIVDAFMWLLFNKDTNDRADFNVKTLDENNNVIPQIEHSVKATIDVSNEIVVIEKTLKEKWSKPRGALEKEFTGNETEYYINDVPKKQKEFEEYIATIINKEVFKMITNPNYFVSLNWKNQRDMLFKITENIDVDEMILQDEKYKELRELLTNKTTDDVKKELQAKKNKLSLDLESIPARIDEVEKGKPEAYTPDENKLKSLNEKIEAKTNILNGSNLDEYQELITKKNEIKMSLINDEQNYNMDKQKALNEFKSGPQQKISEIDSKIDSIKFKIVDEQVLKKDVEILEDKLEAARAENIALKSQIFTFNENDTICPTCKRELDNASEIKEQLENNFNNNKVQNLERNISNGKEMKNDLEKQKEALNNAGIKNKELCDEIAQLTKENQEVLNIHTNFSYPAYEVDQSKINEIEDIDKQLEVYEKAKEAHANVKLEISELQQELANEKAKEYNNTLIKQVDERIVELKEQYNINNNAIANVEKSQDLLMMFLKEKVSLTENAINKNFLITKFKMFNQLVNGGIDETCVATYNGVPYSDLNNAMKINVGIDIINALSIYFSVTAPIFIDNRESVTEIIKTDSQVINLIVSSEDKSLRIGGKINE